MVLCGVINRLFMYTYSFYDNSTDALIDFVVKYDYQLTFGDLVKLKDKSYKIVGTKFNLSDTDNRRKTFYVEEVSI